MACMHNAATRTVLWVSDRQVKLILWIQWDTLTEPPYNSQSVPTPKWQLIKAANWAISSVFVNSHIFLGSQRLTLNPCTYLAESLIHWEIKLRLITRCEMLQYRISPCLPKNLKKTRNYMMKLEAAWKIAPVGFSARRAHLKWLSRVSILRVKMVPSWAA